MEDRPKSAVTKILFPVFHCQWGDKTKSNYPRRRKIFIPRFWSYSIISWWLNYVCLTSQSSSLSFPGDSDSKEFLFTAGDLGWIPGLWRSLGEGKGYPLQYSGPEISMDRGTWWATVRAVTKSQTWLSNFHFQLFEGQRSFSQTKIFYVLVGRVD